MADTSSRVRELERDLETVRRLRESGTIDAFFEARAELSSTADFVQMFDSTVVRAHISAAGAKGGSRIRRSAARGAAS